MGFVFTYGDTVEVRRTSPDNYRPGDTGEICGMTVLKRQDSADFPDDAREPDGSVVAYTVEFSDGASELVPECFLVACQ